MNLVRFSALANIRQYLPKEERSGRALETLQQRGSSRSNRNAVQQIGIMLGSNFRTILDGSWRVVLGLPLAKEHGYILDVQSYYDVISLLLGQKNLNGTIDIFLKRNRLLLLHFMD